ncbi:unnamed protein product [Mytilus coruscus]|uniref:Ribosomal protein eL8/eL30/eS12/Gadd45 domain-containing protein n=1 Tax=Mytilus coruscus TaxID=42192 RepID=A0A6J8DEH2_MYTCO|nr:unnamed protein product [Mytilus coruscus]
MTFPEATNMTGDCKAKSMNIGEAVKETLIRAKSEDRITSGIYSSVKILQISPEMVMLCLIMDAHPSEDVSIHIQHTLIEAYCLEQDIHFLKVSNLDKIGEVLELPAGEFRNSKVDYSCVLVQHSKFQSNFDDVIAEFCDKSLFADDMFARPVIDLPV